MPPCHSSTGVDADAAAGGGDDAGQHACAELQRAHQKQYTRARSRSRALIRSRCPASTSITPHRRRGSSGLLWATAVEYLRSGTPLSGTPRRGARRTQSGPGIRFACTSDAIDDPDHKGFWSTLRLWNRWRHGVTTTYSSTRMAQRRRSSSWTSSARRQVSRQARHRQKEEGGARDAEALCCHCDGEPFTQSTVFTVHLSGGPQFSLST